MKLLAGFTLGVATVSGLVAVAFIGGFVDAELEQRRKDRRRPTEVRHIYRTPARWGPVR